MFEELNVTLRKGQEKSKRLAAETEREEEHFFIPFKDETESGVGGGKTYCFLS